MFDFHSLKRVNTIGCFLWTKYIVFLKKVERQMVENGMESKFFMLINK